MATYATNAMRGGTKVLIDNAPHSIISNEMIKPGKGQAFNRIKMRNLKTGRVIEKTLKSGDTLEAADVIEIEVQYLYNDGGQCFFMHPESFEQYAVDQSAIEETRQWLKENDLCQLTLWNNEPISVTPPNFVELKIVETDPGLKGDTAGSGGKPAKLETGATVRVPLFVQNGEVVKVDTRTGEYVARAKETS